MYSEKLDSVRALLEEHNAAVGEKSPGFVNVDLFIDNLKAYGATTEERLKSLSHEDILECFPALGGMKPKLLAKEIANIFRGKEVATSSEKRPPSSKKVDRMTPAELVANFDPENWQNSVGKALKSIANNEPFIVYTTGRLIDENVTLTLLMEVKQGYKGRQDYTVGGEVKKVYRLGELPENYVDENPIYANRPLRPDGTCDQTGRSWEGVPHNVRQLIRLVIESKEVTATIDTAHALLDLALGATPFATLSARYRKAAVRFGELSSNGNLPKLKIALGQVDETPLANGKKVEWFEENLPPLPPKQLPVNNYRHMIAKHDKQGAVWYAAPQNQSLTYLSSSNDNR